MMPTSTNPRLLNLVIVLLTSTTDLNTGALSGGCLLLYRLKFTNAIIVTGIIIMRWYTVMKYGTCHLGVIIMI